MQPVQLDFLLYLCLGCFQKPSSNEQILLDISLSQTNNILLTFHQPTYPEKTVACTLSPRNIMSKNSALFRSWGKEDTKQKNTIFLNSALLHTLESTSMIWVGFFWQSATRISPCPIKKSFYLNEMIKRGGRERDK